MKSLKMLVCGAVVAVLGLPAVGDVIYDSFGSYNGHAFALADGQEVGNEITIPNGVYTLTNFAIEYYSPNLTLSPSVGIDVRFYLNDGPTVNGFSTPGSMFYDSGWFYNTALGGLPANGFQVVTYNSSDFYGGSVMNLPNGYQLPGDFTFAITFTNLDANNQVQLPLADSQPGTSYGDYWLNNGGSWLLMTNATSAANLVVDLAGTVPEPGTVGLVAIGGVLLAGVKAWRRKR
jgi:hypothetical protein